MSDNFHLDPCFDCTISQMCPQFTYLNFGVII